jgi:hypothetical protein
MPVSVRFGGKTIIAGKTSAAGYLGICIIIFYLSKHPGVFSAPINNIVQLKLVGFFLK